MRGRPRLPRSVKEQRGTLRKCRENPNAIAVEPGTIPDAPRLLTREQKEAWNELKAALSPRGTYSDGDLPAFRLLVQVYAKAMYPDPRDPPSAVVRNSQIASSLLARFGLDPASRDKVSAPKKEGDAAADFLFGGGLSVVNGGKSDPQ